MTDVILTNQSQIEEQIKTELSRRMKFALNNLVFEIISTELPKGYASSISDKLYAKEVAPGHFQVMANRVWVYLNDGTGIYSSKHRGQGPNGEIIPIATKALHFKNKELANALGFKSEDVFLKSVKGIQPRFYWDRYFTAPRIIENMAKA